MKLPPGNIFRTAILITLPHFLSLSLPAQIRFPGTAPGSAAVFFRGNQFVISNKALRLSYTFDRQQVRLQKLTDHLNHQELKLGGSPLFTLTMKDGSVLTPADFKLEQRPQVLRIKGDRHALKKAAQVNGKYVRFTMTSKQGIRAEINVILLDGSNYVRQSLTFAVRDSLPVSKITLLSFPRSPEVSRCGAVDGTPLVTGHMFFGIEHPMSQAEETSTQFRSVLLRQNAVTSAAPLTLSGVIGVTPPGQLRRGYLYYVERERNRPYHQVLHYNSWYDLSWTDRKLDEASCIERIQTYADSLVVKRQTPLNAFLFDDGWDDNKTLWQFNQGFPGGFQHTAALAQKYGAYLGIWISPWGGYLEDQQQRLKYGRMQQPPFETNAHGFSLAGPVYYDRFRAVTTSFVKREGVKLFKFDGVGAGNGAAGASVTYQKDIESLLQLITDLRAVQPELYFSLTVGTWPSVYWLNYGDVIWRAGMDTHCTGSGSKRQQWLTYRDGEAYRNIVKRAPLYPLNALMYHGICIAGHGVPASFNSDDADIRDEIWSFFANGTSLQELYIDPHRLTSGQWDALAAAIRWSRSSAAVLADTHWIGGDPEAGDVYGFASWTPEKALFSLRNPGDHTQSYTVDFGKIFELPAGSQYQYQIKQVYGRGADASLTTGYHRSVVVNLLPHEVRVFNALPGPPKTAAGGQHHSKLKLK